MVKPSIAFDLELRVDYFASLVGRPMATLRLLRYPPPSGVFSVVAATAPERLRTTAT